MTDEHPPTKDEHLATCRAIALATLEKGDLLQTFRVMLEEARKHGETMPSSQLYQDGLGRVAANDKDGLKAWIESYR